MDKELEGGLREKALGKIRKLLALARDGGATEAEAAAAARQAEKMMRAYQIADAEVVMREIEQDESFDRALAEVSPDVRRGQCPSNCPPWTGILAVGVARAFTCKVDMVRTAVGVKLRFSGYSLDVGLAAWVFGYLSETVWRLSKAHGGDRSAGTSFRNAAATELQRRLFGIAAEREAENNRDRNTGGGTALALYDRKAERVREMFGEQKTKEQKQSPTDFAAAIAGREAGRQIPIHTNRPVDAPADRRRLS